MADLIYICEMQTKGSRALPMKTKPNERAKLLPVLLLDSPFQGANRNRQVGLLVSNSWVAVVKIYP